SMAPLYSVTRASVLVVAASSAPGAREVNLAVRVSGISAYTEINTAMTRATLLGVFFDLARPRHRIKPEPPTTPRKAPLEAGIVAPIAQSTYTAAQRIRAPFALAV